MMSGACAEVIFPRDAFGREKRFPLRLVPSTRCWRGREGVRGGTSGGRSAPPAHPLRAWYLEAPGSCDCILNKYIEYLPEKG